MQADQCAHNEACGGYRHPYEKGTQIISSDRSETNDDRLAPYTLWLAVFTGALFFASAWQGYFLIRADRTAREAADAALKTAIAIGTQNSQIERSIAEAGRSADAMDNVAAEIKETVKINQNMADRQTLVSELQSRAYLSIGFLDMIPQNLATGIRFEPRLRLINDGVMTPAYKITYRIAADILDHPLKGDFNFPLPGINPTRSVSTIGPRQNRIMSAVVPNKYMEEETREIKIGFKRRIHIWGRVDYEDAFHIPRYVNFCSSFSWVGTDKNGNDIIMAYDTAGNNDSN